MKKNYVNYIFTTATILICLFTLCFGIYEYRREHAFRCDILHAQLQLNNHTLQDPSIRVTVIDLLGNVLSDNREKDVSKMGNHLLRKEVQDALRNGQGYAIKRASETDNETYFYSATYFPAQGKIVRSAVPYSAPLTASLERDYTFFYYTAGILALIAIASYLRHRLGKSEKEKQQIKHQLTENAAHELKTPAATIQGYLETLVLNPDLPEEKKSEFISNCYTQSLRMSRLLSDMSTLTRLDEARMSRPSTSIDAAKILRQIEEETAAQFREHGIQPHIDIPPHLPMQGDSLQIYSLFRNIFSNTLAYALGATYFRVTVKKSKDRYTFTFSDNGIGVPSEHLPHIFERFYRIDKGRSRRLGGTGLGLAIVRHIALLYHGTTSATTTEGGKGLTLTVEISTS